MKKLLYAAVLITAFLIWACGSTPDKESTAEITTNWEFQLQDSIQLDLLGTPTLADAEFGKYPLYHFIRCRAARNPTEAVQGVVEVDAGQVHRN